MMAAISAGARRQLTATFTAPMSEPPNRKSKYGDAVAVEEGDPVADAEPVALRRLRHTAGDVELLGPGAALVALDQHLVVRLLARQVAQQSRHRVAVLFGDGDARCHP